MRFYGLTTAALLVGGAVEFAVAQQLEQQNIQEGSTITGQEQGAEAGQAASLTYVSPVERKIILALTGRVQVRGQLYQFLFGRKFLPGQTQQWSAEEGWLLQL